MGRTHGPRPGSGCQAQPSPPRAFSSVNTTIPRPAGRAAADERVRAADPGGARAGHPGVGGLPRAHPRGPGRHRRRPARRAAVPGRGVRPAQPGVSGDAGRPVADRAASAGRRRRRRARRRDGLRAGRGAGDPAVHGRQHVLRPDGQDGGRAAPAAPPRPARPPRAADDGPAPDRYRGAGTGRPGSPTTSSVRRHASRLRLCCQVKPPGRRHAWPLCSASRTTNASGQPSGQPVPALSAFASATRMPPVDGVRSRCRRRGQLALASG